MKKISFLAAALLAFAPLTASAQEFTPISDLPAGTYQLDKSHASLTWKVSHAGLSNYTARFTNFDAAIKFDPKDLTKSSVTASIDPTSIQTDYPNAAEKDFNKELATGDKWFNAGKFPKITFESTKLEKTGKESGKLHGNVTLLGVTKPVVLDVTYNGGYAVQPFSQKPTIGFSATGVIKRSDFGFDTYVPAIGDNVQIIIEAEFAKNN
jgi:polyisoprenoid-binding protein YceI